MNINFELYEWYMLHVRAKSFMIETKMGVNRVINDNLRKNYETTDIYTEMSMNIREMCIRLLLHKPQMKTIYTF